MKKALIWLLMTMIVLTADLLNASEVCPNEIYEKIKPHTIMAQDGTLIMSNSPETVKRTGILYQDQLAGVGRLLFHHVNGTQAADKKLVIVIENLTEDTQIFMIRRHGISQPSYNYLQVGEEILDDYFSCMTSETFFVSPKQKEIIFDSSVTGWPVQTVLSGMMDVEATGLIQVTFAMIRQEEDVDTIDCLEALDRDSAPRGTFNCLSKYQFLILPESGNSYYLIEEDEEEWVKGWDALTQQIAINYGNYGIMYKITLITLSDINILICPRGGIFQGKIYWEDGKLITIKRPHVFKVIKEPVKIGHLKAGEVKSLIYFLPNGSAAPVLIGFDDV